METEEVITAVSYGRLSRKDGGNSVERQRAINQRNADKLGWTIDTVLEEWVPASLIGRPPSKTSRRYRTKWEELINGLHAGRWNAVIFWMPDRSARHVLIGAELVDACKEAGVTKVNIGGINYDLTNPLDEARYLGEVAQAQIEVAKMAQRIREAKLESAQNGEENRGGSRPFGFKGTGKHQVSRLRALQEQDCVWEAARRVIAGDSIRAIVQDWNKRKIKTATDGEWRTATLRQMLLSPRIAGYRVHRVHRYKNGKRELVSETLYPAEGWTGILDDKTWRQVREILTDPKRTTTVGGGQPKYELTSFLWCSECDARLRCRLQRYGGKQANSNRYLTYYCQRFHVARSAEKLERYIEDKLFDEVERRAKVWAETARELNKDDSTRPLLERLAQNQARLDGLDAREDAALELELDGKEEEAQRLRSSIERLRARYIAEQDRDREQLTQLQGERVEANIPPNLREIWTDLSLDRRRAILAAVFRGKKIVVYPQQHAGPFFDENAVRVVPIEAAPV
jgi:site-specific DNA recombinase